MELIYAFIHSTARSDPVSRIGYINMEHNSAWPWSWALRQYWQNKPWLKWHDSKTCKGVWEQCCCSWRNPPQQEKRSDSNYTSKLGHLSRVVFIARCTENSFIVKRFTVWNVIRSLCATRWRSLVWHRPSYSGLLRQLNHDCNQRLLLWPMQLKCNSKPRGVKIK